jgi:hypothetical protein
MRRLKKPVAGVILLASASISGLPAQSIRPDPALQQPASGRASYDPMARGKGSSGQPKGIVETTLAGLNPRNTDYGAVVEDWRKEICENTLHEFSFWALIGMTALLGTSLMANGWLLRERERRLAITADIVAQLYNAYVTARARVFTVIGKHNQLVEKYNLLDEGAAVLKARSVEVPAVAPEAIDFADAREAKVGEGGAPSEQRQSQQIVDGTEDAREQSTEAEWRNKLEQLENKLKRKEAQLQAKDNQITNLRTRLSLAHDTLQGERAGKLSAK